MTLPSLILPLLINQLICGGCSEGGHDVDVLSLQKLGEFLVVLDVAHFKYA